ncbi:MAG: biotin/lipoyl-binding protein, partial [Oscillospiraceae bacterium]|nr:biotin/lipoyl-binding protein [Oscillospiraceae bacterium]
MNLKKRIISMVLALLIVGGCAFGGVYAWQHRARKEVKVYHIGEDFAMTDYWGDTSYTDGQVTVEGMQQVYLSDTQSVNEVLVHEGQEVKKGDVLLTYDTTLTELEVRKKDVTVQQLELELENAQKELARVKSYRPNRYIPGSVTTFVIPGIPAPVEEPFQDDGTLKLLGGSGSYSDPYTYQWDSSYAFDDAFLYQCMRGDRDCYVKFVLSGSGDVPEHEHVAKGDWEYDENGHYHICAICGAEFDREDHDFWTKTDSLPDIDKKGEWHQECVICHAPGKKGTYDAIEAPTPEPEPKEDDDEGNEDASQQPPSNENESDQDNSSSENTSNPTPAKTEGTDAIEGYLLMQMQHSDAGYQIQILSIDVPSTDAFVTLFQWNDGQKLPELPEPEPVEDIPSQTVTDGIKYTAEELNAMLVDAEAKVRDLDVQLRQAKLEYEKAEQELNNGSITATMDGKVTSILSEDEAKDNSSALMQVTAGGGFYVQGTLSELELEGIEIGQTVSVNSWMSGTECEGTIVAISDYPSGSSNWGEGNSNVSYYPFTVFISEDAGLKEGEYVEIEYSAAQSEGGFYLESMFIRTENGRSYVYVQNDEGRLEKRY